MEKDAGEIFRELKKRFFLAYVGLKLETPKIKHI